MCSLGSLLTFLFVPGFVATGIGHLTKSIIATAVGLIVLMLIAAALPIKRKVTATEWANELEKHLLETDGPYGWDDATSVALADERLESVRSRLIPNFDLLDTPEKREELRKIIEALRHGEIP